MLTLVYFTVVGYLVSFLIPVCHGKIYYFDIIKNVIENINY